MTDILANIKASAAGKSPAELAQMRRDIAAHVRGLEPHERGGWDEMVRTRGQAHAEELAVRLSRHRAELEHLDALLQSLDPVLAAQAAAQ